MLRVLVSAVAIVLAVPLAQAAEHERGVLAGAHTAKQFVAGREVRVSADVSNDIFAAGGNVAFADTSAADIYAAGGNVSFSRSTAESITAAGGKLRYRDTRVGDLTVAGGDLEIDARIAKDLLAAGGSVRLRPNTAISGDAIVAGGRLVIDGAIAGDLRARGGEIRIEGAVSGDVDLAGGQIIIAPDARIGGDLKYRSRRPASIAPGSVAGEIVQAKRLQQRIGLQLLGVWARIGIFFGLALAALVLYGATPATVDGAVDTLIARPGASISVGLAIFVLIPVVALVLLVTIIGLPLAMLLGALYFAGFVPAILTIATWAGGRLAHLVGQSPSLWGERFFWLLVGLAALVAVSAIPVVGPLLSLAALLFGIGALTMEIGRGERTT